MPTYQSPGVYIEEKSTLPPSVAEVSTAVPAFFGYTKTGSSDQGPVIARVKTLLEFVERFGGAKPQGFKVTQPTEGDSLTIERTQDGFRYLLYDALSHYFQNGGGPCYIVSVGNLEGNPTKAHFEDGLKLLEKEDEPTLILLTDAIGLKAADYYTLADLALAQCMKLGDRFAIFDIPGSDVPAFRSGIGANNLMYGAAYYPNLHTTLNPGYDPDEVIAVREGAGDDDPGITLASLESGETARYNKIRAALANERIELPPSAAIAGVYASVDGTRGVWKTPANVSLTGVIAPTEKITAEDQAGLNIDPTGGKSINVIRAFTGRGVLVWGGRTLAGNDNEWRYVSVRRFFNMIEESTKKASAFAVFEPNDATTWLKVKGMIEAYLFGLWEQGALAGPTPEAAYFVNVGLGKTMTTQDVLEGRMIVEIGVAAVRPAEFIILRFTHKQQEA